MIRYISIVFPLIAFSCEKEVHLDNEIKTPRITVNGILDPEHSIELEISESAFILQSGFKMPALENAKALLYDSDYNLLGEFEHETLGVYYLPGVQVVSESTYFIKVSCPGFNDVTSKTIVPRAPINVDYQMQFKDDIVSYQISFQDDAAEVNYYWVSIVQMKKTEYGFNGFSDINRHICSNNVAVENQSEIIGEASICDKFLFFSDQTFNGNAFQINFDQSNSKEANDTVISILNFKSVSEDYYKYLITREAYASHQQDPFAQPGQVHTNIENGFGILAGSNTFSDTIYW
ncbi:MAG: DUF4249 domain-containing protein [Crocinitomicaceae bacterium]|nr:DUF4249 domain-containing protein [Crocinitomicaceae bacterium]